jgi:hypothetical protein
MAHSSTTTRNGSCQNCSIEAFSRNHYWNGKLLVERDFRDEQAYYMEKMRHHEQRLHGWGVVCGLNVIPHAKCPDRYVVITPGTAIDCCGHEIVVTHEENVDITAFEEVSKLFDERRANGSGNNAAHTLQICIRYHECPTEEIPKLYDDCGCDDTQCAPNRILESFEIEVHVVEPALPRTTLVLARGDDVPTDLSGHPTEADQPEPEEEVPPREEHDCHFRDSDCPVCDNGHCVVLATITNYRPGRKIQAQPKPGEEFDPDVALITWDGRKLLPSVEAVREVVECLLERGGVGHAGKDGKDGTDGKDGVDGKDGAPGTGLETGLYGICALSWTHGQADGKLNQTLLEIREGRRVLGRGIVIGFTGDVIVPGGLLQPPPTPENDLYWQNVLQVFLPDGQNQEAPLLCACPARGRVRAVDWAQHPVAGKGGVITKAAAIDADKASGIAFIFDKPSQDLLEKLLGSGSVDLRVVLRGDFVRDDQDRVIDAEFIRGDLPTANRLSAQPPTPYLGLRGGTFESWFRILG